MPDGTRGDVVAFVFTSVDCPIANAMAPQLGRTLKLARSKGVRTYLVYPRVGTTRESMNAHALAYGLACPQIADPDKVLVNRLDATITPEGVVIEYLDDTQYTVRYRGRLNDLYPSIGNRRDQPSSYEFRDAIIAVVEQRPVSTPYPPAVGCMIERAP